MSKTVQHLPASAVEPTSDSIPLEVSVLDILILLRRRMRMLLISAVTCGALGFVIASLEPKVYTATTSILPPQQASSSSSLLAQLGGLGSLAGLGGGAGIKSTTDLYIGLMKSVTVEDGMIRHFHLDDEFKEKYHSLVRRDLENITKFDGTGKDGLIRISVTEKSPQRAAELANGWIQEYQRLSSSLALGEASQRRLFLEQQLAQVKTNLTTSEEELKRIQQTSGLIQLDSQARALIETTAGLRAQIAAKEVQIQSMQTYSGTGNVDLISAQQELSSLRAQLTKLGGGQSGNIGDPIVPQGKLPQLGLDYGRKTREVRYNETLYEILARQFEAAKLDEAREGAVIQVVDRALPPDYKSGPSRLKLLLAGFFIGLFVPMAWVLWGGMIRFLRRSPDWAVKLDALGGKS
ncbi:GumC family protein [Terriglobus roseus]|uniref:GumC family protein n=1 Tax=Terriglobus roseus TaxID=392734 RepID=UPI001BAED7C5|nr:Wzz/FepE/Etk N-terminal domain-containing protein [Terriglobus roseus]